MDYLAAQAKYEQHIKLLKELEEEEKKQEKDEESKQDKQRNRNDDNSKDISYTNIPLIKLSDKDKTFTDAPLSNEIE